MQRAHPVRQLPEPGAQALPTYDRHVRPVEKKRRESKGRENEEERESEREGGREGKREREARMDVYVVGIRKSTADRRSNVLPMRE